MAKSEIQCQYLQDGNCKSVMENDEAKEARRTACNNDNEQACCYLCSHYHGCGISCVFLGENKNKSKDRAKIIKTEAKQPSILRCPLCDSKMIHTKINLRAGGWEGVTKGLPLGIGEFGELDEELLPVIIFVCPNCGKLELIAQEKTKQKIIDRS
jgi:hypothetical protein